MKVDSFSTVNNWDSIYVAFLTNISYDFILHANVIAAELSSELAGASMS